MERVLRHGERLRTRLLDVRHLHSELGHLRVGIVVPKFGLTAVRRNKLKRQLRELVRLRMLSDSHSCDVVIRARREAYDAAFESLSDDLARVPAQLTAVA